MYVRSVPPFAPMHAKALQVRRRPPAVLQDSWSAPASHGSLRHGTITTHVDHPRDPVNASVHSLTAIIRSTRPDAPTAPARARAKRNPWETLETRTARA